MTRLRTPFGRPARTEDVDQRPGAARHQVGRLDHHRVAVAERRRDLPGGNGDREVPRRDDADDADRLAGHRRRRCRGGRSAPSRRRDAGIRRRRNRRSAPARTVSPMPSASVLPSSRDKQPAELLACGPGSRRRPSSGCRGAAGCRSATRPGRPPWPRRSPPRRPRRCRARMADDFVGVGRIDVGDGLAVDPFAGDVVACTSSSSSSVSSLPDVSHVVRCGRIRAP